MLNIKDIFILGAISGMIANIPINFFDYLGYKFNFNIYHAWHIAASSYFLKKDVTTLPALIVGATSDYSMAGLKGVIIALILKTTSKDYYLFKGIGAGLIFWLIAFGIILRLKIGRIDPTDASTNLVHLSWHIILGLLTAWLIVTLGTVF